jgi:ribonuclease HI
VRRALIFLYFDGLCEPINPGGIATYGYVIFKDSRKIFEESGVVGAGYRGDDVSNNVAEYTALIKGLEWLLFNYKSEDEVVIRGDSQLVIMQLKGKYKVRAFRLIPLYSKAMELLKQIPNFSRVEWIPRRENSLADELTRKALKEFVRKNYSEVSLAYGKGWADLVLEDPNPRWT